MDATIQPYDVLSMDFSSLENLSTEDSGGHVMGTCLPKDEAFSSFASDGLPQTPAVLKNKGINDLSTEHTSPSVKNKISGIVTKIFKGLMGHVAIATRTIDGSGI